MPFRVELRRGAERFRTRAAGLDTWHSLSFAHHYDPTQISFGAILAHNDDRIAPGAGYPMHPHRDIEIVTWVLAGTLTHRDSTGRIGTLPAGRAQLLRAGRGISHAETNDGAGPVRLVQTWLAPETHGGEPAYDRLRRPVDLAGGGLVTVAAGPSPRPAGAGRVAGTVLRLRAAATLSAARPQPADPPLILPAAAYLHLYVARGAVAVPGVGQLTAGDALRVTAAGEPAGDGVRLRAAEPAEVLIWRMGAGPACPAGPAPAG